MSSIDWDLIERLYEDDEESHPCEDCGDHDPDVEWQEDQGANLCDDCYWDRIGEDEDE